MHWSDCERGLWDTHSSTKPFAIIVGKVRLTILWSIWNSLQHINCLHRCVGLDYYIYCIGISCQKLHIFLDIFRNNTTISFLWLVCWAYCFMWLEIIIACSVFYLVTLTFYTKLMGHELVTGLRLYVKVMSRFHSFIIVFIYFLSRFLFCSISPHFVLELSLAVFRSKSSVSPLQIS